MANFMTTLLLLILGFVSSVEATDIPLHNENILGAIESMQKANYFTFVMLLKIAPPDLFAGNVTFLMPNDRMLAKAIMPQTAVIDFLLGHSIPLPLLFDNLIHFPTGSLLPTSRPDLMLNVTNNGRQSFFLNNVRIFSLNFCTRATSITCLGIDAVLRPSELNMPRAIPCQATNSSNPPDAVPLPSVSPPASTTTDGHQAAGDVHLPVVSAAAKQKLVSHRKNHRERLFQIIINVYLIVVSYTICFA